MALLRVGSLLGLICSALLGCRPPSARIPRGPTLTVVAPHYHTIRRRLPALAVPGHAYEYFMENQVLFGDGIIDSAELARLIPSARDEREVRGLLAALSTMDLSAEALGSKALGEFTERNSEHLQARLLGARVAARDGDREAPAVAGAEAMAAALERIEECSPEKAFEMVAGEARLELPYVAVRRKLGPKPFRCLIAHPFLGPLAMDAAAWSRHRAYYLEFLRQERGRFTVEDTPVHLAMIARAVGLAGSERDAHILRSARDSLPRAEWRGKPVVAIRSHSPVENRVGRLGLF